MAIFRETYSGHHCTLTVIAGILLVFVCTGGPAFSAELLFTGYIRENPLLWQPSPIYSSVAEGQDQQITNLLHVRQNLRFFVANPVIAGLELKERFFLGQDASLLAREITAFNLRPPRFDWTREVVDEDNAYLEISIDRFWIELTRGRLELTAGRQRIAWGTNLIWNPIDIFNPSSPLDFDNEEKPGTDALRLQYYLGPNSVLEAAWAPGREAASTSAALRMKINHRGYDWIIIGGRRATEHVVGFAWAGSIADGGFRGECLYANPRSGGDEKGEASLSTSISGDYTFSSTLYLQASALYNSRGTSGSAGGEALVQSYLRGDLTPSRFALLGEIARDLTPLWRADLIVIVNPCDRSGYYGPSLRWSAITDLDLTMQVLLFSGDEGTEFGDQGHILMLKGKYSF
jgi:hypothetical protein